MTHSRLRQAALTAMAITSTTALAVPLPGGTLDPLSIPKYVTPLVIPPEMPKSGSTADGDYYEIAVRQFGQQILPAGLPSTTVWSYGSVNHDGTFHYPAFTIEAESHRNTTVKWINGLVDGNGKFLPHLFPVDQTLHWANPGQSCADQTMRTDCAGSDPTPYTGPVPLVTHVHGAHVGPESDGYPEAWWLPAATDIPAGFAMHGSRWGQAMGHAATDGAAVFSYPNTQPSTTLWYHDHALGMTRLNVYAGPAGFWLVRRQNGGETGLRDGTLPGPSPKAGDPAGTRYYEIPIAIQDRSFNVDGSLFYPQNRAFFEGVGPEQLKIPFIGDATTASDISPIWNPEAFFNTMVVNGKTWPYLDVDQGLYRLRLLNGSNSRFLNLALFVVNPDGTLGREIPFYQIGNDQGLLSDVVQVQTGSHIVFDDETRTELPAFMTDPQQALLMAPAERADVLVDFGKLRAGTRVRMINTAPDAPFGGFPDIPADPATTGQVMEFVVGPNAAPLFTKPTKLALDDVAPLVPTTPMPRRLSLNEEESALVCVNVDVITGDISYTGAPPCATGIPFAPKAAKLGTLAGMMMPMPMAWMDAVTETPMLGDIEEWEIHNATMDAHPIHLHLVKFQVVSRQAGPGMGGGPMGPVMPPLPNELGWKDTVIAYPGQITRIRAHFDMPGLYVWHCHIVEHEDNEMMRPMCVVDPANPTACDTMSMPMPPMAM